MIDRRHQRGIEQCAGPLFGQLAAQQAGTKFDLDAESTFLAQQAVGITLAYGARFTSADPDGYTSRIAGIVSANTDILGVDFSKLVLTKANAQLQADMKQYLTITGPGYGVLTGTSMAAPHVSGIAALVRSAHPSWSATQVKAALMSSSSIDDLAGYDPRLMGAGLVSARDAVAATAVATTKDGSGSLSFGFQSSNDRIDETREFTIENLTNSPIRYNLSLAPNLTAFTSVFPMHNPRYAVYMMLDEPKALPETHGFITSGWNAVPTGGKVIAETGRALVLKEASYPPVQYIPRADADMQLLDRTERSTHCPYKGDASYFSIATEEGPRENAVWTYENPPESLADIRDYLAFDPERVDAIEAPDDLTIETWWEQARTLEDE